MEIILGSSSVFRAALLDREGIKYTVIPADIDEKMIRDKNPLRLVLALGIAKSNSVFQKLSSTTRVILVTSDHVLAKGIRDKILEKPLTPKGRPSKGMARRMLKEYGHVSLRAVNSLVVWNLDTNHRTTQIEEAEIILSPFSKAEIEEIVRDPLTYQAAGALPIGMPNSRACEIIESHITKIYGSKDCLMGLSVSKLKRALSVYSNYFATKA